MRKMSGGTPGARLAGCYSNEDGIALMTVVMVAAALMFIGAGLYFVASRESRMASADFQSGQAFYYAEGGVETALDMLNFAATESQLTQLRPDQSSDGYGYLMDPDPAKRENPTNPVQMKIGREQFTVYVDEIQKNDDGTFSHCDTGCGFNVTSPNPAYLLITAEGNAGQGYQKVQQRVKVQASLYPLGLYINGNANANGNISITNQSIYVQGDFKGRDKLTLSGADLITGQPSGVFATGRIYGTSDDKSAIYDDFGQATSYWTGNDANDRDSKGILPNDTFTVQKLQSMFNTSGLTVQQLSELRMQAQTNGYYNGNPPNNMNIQAGDLPRQSGDIVVFVEFPSGNPSDTSNTVNIKFTWPVQGTQGNAIVVVLNGNVTLDGNKVGNFSGSIYCPDGPVKADGTGGNITGSIWGAGLTDIGNFQFNMTQNYLNNPPFFAWQVSRETGWVEVDR